MAKISVPKLNEAREAEAVPEGEYEVRIHSVTEKDSKGGKPMLAVMCLIESADHPDAAPINHYLSLPADDDEERSIKFKNLQIARFCQLFGIEVEDDEIDTDDFEGKTATCTLTLEPFNDDSDEMVNRIRLPRLAADDDEEEDEAPRRRGKAAPPARKGKAKDEDEDEEAEEESADEEESEDEDEAEESDDDDEEEEEEEKPAPKRPQRKAAPPAKKRR
jgi:hypothetical protein